MSEKWKQALGLIGCEQNRQAEHKRQIAKLAHELLARVRTILDGREFSEARRFFYYVVHLPNEIAYAGAMLAIHPKTRGFWGLTPRISSISSPEFETLRQQHKYQYHDSVIRIGIFAGYTVENFGPVTMHSPPTIKLHFNDDDHMPNPWFGTYGYRTPAFIEEDGVWKLQAYENAVTKSCSLDECLLYFLAIKAKAYKLM
jgi:hypothetical protein